MSQAENSSAANAARLPVLSIVVPCYNEEETLGLFTESVNKLKAGMPGVKIELLFIDDGSTDETLPILRALSEKEERLSYISLSRNFGKEAAMLAGLEAARGEYVAVMDADLQDPPELLPRMLDAIINEGFDSVATRRVTRKGESPIRSFFAKSFYKLINKVSKTEIVDGVRDYRLMTRRFVEAVLSLREYNRFSKGLFSWVGFKTKLIEFENVPRAAGATKWSFFKLFVYAIDGVVGFSTAPLAISSLFGIILFVIAFLGIVLVAVRRIVFGDPVSGWASTVCIILFVSGIQLFCVGILGQYMAKAYLETKRRPVYLVKETGNRQ